MKPISLLSLLLIFLSGLSSCSGSESAEQPNNHKEKASSIPVGSSIAATPVELIANDPIYQQTALFLAGIPQEDSCYFSNLEKHDWWQDHRQEMDALWQKAESLRLTQLKEWQQTELSLRIPDTLPLFYPFSGPDFLHAWYFYPYAASYHMIAIEPVVLFPDWYTMSEQQLKQYMTQLRASLRDVIGKSYFITQHMMSDLKEEAVGGVLPVYYVFLARTGHRILHTQSVRLDTAGELVQAATNYHGLKLKITQDGFHSKEITYLDYNLADDYLNIHPEFMKWVESLGPKNAFVKAASYLMHYKGFGEARKAIQINTQSIFQDDTGLPLKYIDGQQWNIRLYGSYTRPIKNFTDQMMQYDLKALYDETPSSDKGTIPFPLGYHVVGDKIQNHQLLTRL